MDKRLEVLKGLKMEMQRKRNLKVFSETARNFIDGADFNFDITYYRNILN